MNTQRVIFVTNDDGYQSKGFAAAVEVARRFGRVIAIAPDGVRSGMSQAITLFNPLYINKVVDEPDVTVYALSGTPVDCVKIAFDHILKDEKIDLVISGINHGSNSAVNVLYSGTLGAAIEASFYGIPSVGLSLLDHSPDADFAASIEYGAKVVAAVLDRLPSQPQLCLNVNVPCLPLERIAGLRVCRQTKGYWHENFYERKDPNGRTYYWMTGAFDNHEPQAEQSDEWALAHGYVSVVPVQVDLTEYRQMPLLEEAFAKG